MMESIIAVQTVTDEQGKQYNFEYHCIISKAVYDESEITEYGVRITQVGGESICIPGITSDWARFEKLTSLLIHGGVTPVSLPDVLEDWL